MNRAIDNLYQCLVNKQQKSRASVKHVCMPSKFRCLLLGSVPRLGCMLFIGGYRFSVKLQPHASPSAG